MAAAQNQPIRVLSWAGTARQPDEPSMPGASPRPEPGPVGLKEILGSVRRHAVGLSAWVVFCLGAASLYLASVPVQYTAATQIVLEPRHQSASSPSDAASVFIPPTLDSAQADSEIEIVRSERNLRSVFDTLDIAHDAAFAPGSPGLLARLLGLLPMKSDAPKLPPAEQAARDEAAAFEAFRERVDVRRIGSSYVLDISFRAPTPDEAARLANAVTAAYIRGQIDLRAAAVERGTEFLQDRIAGLKAERQAAAEGVRTGHIPDIQFTNADARVVGAAVKPLAKSSPQSKLILLFSLVAGLFTGIGAIVLQQSFDRRVRTRVQFHRALGFDCLAVLPRAPTRKGGEVSYTAALDSPNADLARALRVLRTALLATVPGTRAPAVGITSCAPREGRSTLTANLAHLFAAAGQPVTLIDGDVRNPVLTWFYAPNTAGGVSEMLGRHAAQPHLPEIALGRDLAFVPAISASHEADLNLFIGSSEMQKALAEVKGRRAVFVDLPSLGTSSDALAIGPLLDGILLCVEVGRTTLDDVAEAVLSLSSANVRVLGVVLNRMPAM